MTVRGLVIGKFFPYHEGHAHLIRTARAQVDELSVIVCYTKGEHIPGQVRHGWVQAANPDCRVLLMDDELPQTPDEDPRFWERWTERITHYAGRVDRLFTSEAYGDLLAPRLGALHVCVDQPRRAVPISGTAIREDPMANWEYLPTVVRPYFTRR